MNPFTNKKLLASVIVSILLQVAVIYVPLLQDMLGTVPLSLSDWAVIVALASTGFLVLPEIFMRKTIRSIDYIA